ncbi:hypothetical protein ACIBSS_17600 [Micromonospora aurantiaca]|uniref:hypothetical protein n=1 Tax=Micromonospora aurantiaca (nom. illeg.) TaxID=47850 RepID=UPI0037B26DCE
MVTIEVQLPEAVAARLADAAASAGAPVDRFSAALLAMLLEQGVFTPDGPPQAATGVPAGADGPDAPEGVTLASLALALLRDDREGAAVILRGVSLPLLLADAVAMINRIGIDSLGVEGWDARLQAALTDAAARRAEGAS